MKKKAIFILIGILVVCFIGASVFFAWQGTSAAQKEQEYFDVYRDRAEDYIKADVEIANKYAGNISVEFDNSVTYLESGERGKFDKFIELFAPDVPDSLEEFNKGIDMIKYNVKINKDEYLIVFQKNIEGELIVSSLTEKE